MNDLIKCPALLWHEDHPTDRWQCELEAGHDGPHAHVLGWRWTDGEAPTLAAQPPPTTEVGCTARKGALACGRAAWHPGGHECDGVSWYSGDVPGQLDDAHRRIEEKV